ncbi:cation diffusion facilitator family transporter [Aggregatilinea lenta]|uniref:cation diffusion facilitator family transporter n=1 Tax=Aggregatilinea lenta TaxID=913108 RepID=UPI000E5A4847|nr:cation diffusion facilitator family transporter [Aggregatilinea lenta]
MEVIHSGTASHRRALWIVLSLTGVFLAVEFVTGLLTNSLALVADAAHMLTDVGGLALALFAAWISTKPRTAEKTYGYYRVEIMAALLNAVVLFGTGLYILYEAYQRFRDPPEVVSVPMLIVAVIGLVVNLIGIRVLHGASQESLNLQGAFLEVVSDTLGSLGVIIAAAVMWAFGWMLADPVISVVISVFIFPRAWKLMGEAVHVLLEGAPADVDVSEVRAALAGIEGVAGVHDLHVWTITTGADSLSAHVVLAQGATIDRAQRVLDTIRVLTQEQFGIAHTTIQIEPSSLEREEPAL